MELVNWDKSAKKLAVDAMENKGSGILLFVTTSSVCQAWYPLGTMDTKPGAKGPEL
jgi:hypothetical protein